MYEKIRRWREEEHIESLGEFPHWLCETFRSPRVTLAEASLARQASSRMQEATPRVTVCVRVCVCV